MDIPIDFLGNTIVKGDFVVYPARQSSSIWMNVAEVVDIKESKYGYSGTRLRVLVRKKSKNYKGEVDEKVVSIVCFNRLVVVPGVTWEKILETKNEAP